MKKRARARRSAPIVARQAMKKCASITTDLGRLLGRMSRARRVMEDDRDLEIMENCARVASMVAQTIRMLAKSSKAPIRRPTARVPA
ncbi:MAG: hypothetical protein K1Y01_07725 [Vicinamibacteria bacterium]|nr:hypothetical protein [Vicinamibacteria bacterium]